MSENKTKTEEVVRNLILRSAQEANILPITSACNVRCIFCSHKQNPPEVKVFSIAPRTLEEIKDTLEFLAKDKKIVIGESVTKINEGEPFTHPKIREILTLIRCKFPTTPLQITSNGTYFTKDMVAFLEAIGNVEINLSLNSCSWQQRERLMKDRFAQTAVNSAALLMEYKIPFHGSLVAMPFITGWEDLKNTLEYLDQYQANSIRVFLPGYTRLALKELRFSKALWEEISGFVRSVKENLKTPIIFEPERLANLQAVVEGVIKASPAALAGLKIGDTLNKVDGIGVFSRVDAFKKVYQKKNPQVEFTRNKALHRAKIVKQEKQSSGLVMAYDLDPQIINSILRELKSRKARKVLILTSYLAHDVLSTALSETLKSENNGGDLDYSIEIVPSIFFGGTIMAAGLLLVEDFRKVLKEKDLENCDLVLLPGVAFDHQGRDLIGTSYSKLELEFGVQISVI